MLIAKLFSFIKMIFYYKTVAIMDWLIILTSILIVAFIVFLIIASKKKRK